MLSRYWRLPPVAHPNGDFADLREEIHHLLGESVRRTLLADVPVGVFLSGGLDSSSIVALASQHCSQLATFTVTFDGEGARYDEREPAAQVARHFGTRHQELCVSGNSADLLPTIVRHFDQPFGNPTALLSYLISQATRHEVKVVLGGDGGDELFGGYPRYRGIRWARTYGLLPAGLRGWASRLAQHLPESRAGAHNWRRTRQFLTATLQSPAAMYLEWVGYFGPALKAELYTEPLRRRVEGHRAERFLERLLAAEDGDFLSGAMRADLHSFLPGNILEYGDKMSMAHGLELRLPFLDPQLVERIASLPADLKMRAGQPKYLLRRMMSDRLPPFVLRRSKAGFNPPMGMWIEGELRDKLDEYLGVEAVRARGYFQIDQINRMREMHRRGRRDYSQHLWALLVLEEWHRQYID